MNAESPLFEPPNDSDHSFVFCYNSLEENIECPSTIYTCKKCGIICDTNDLEYNLFISKRDKWTWTLVGNELSCDELVIKDIIE